MTHKPRIEITSMHRNPANRRIFRLVLHDRGPRTVWTGTDYGEAILAAETWALQGVDVIDRVEIRLPHCLSRIPAPARATFFTPGKMK